ncbi:MULTISPECIES: histidine kinase dimerization/phosphoacceptor domain -containing protein [Mesorhizobium]|uniref:PAS domain-containing protein n=1 Tax=Mesorhizobium denitrificans TaxID=2294114 RepID=A0A371XGK5_9HYPH|nr:MULTISPECIES: histidine kinase dimerization/phosphoacceptor domain -containing protein [Mesorhizobium]RFC68323.1 PAS domain-containing protein [Mesorhizobium denitrificans]
MNDATNRNDWHQTDDLHAPRGKGDPFAAAIRATRMPMLITDPNQPDNPIVFANEAFFKLTGYSHCEVIGKNCRFLQGPQTNFNDVAKIRDAVQNREDIAVDLLNYRKDGSSFWNALYMSPVIDESGKLLYFFASQLDVTERKQAEQEIFQQKTSFEVAVRARTKELERALESKNTLIHEVDHRVKNNLQIVASLILMQSRNVKDEAARDTLRSVLGRIEALSAVHKLLYQSNDLPLLNVAHLVRDLVTNLMASSARENIAVSFDLDDIEVPAEKASPIALLINELVTNALKHAFEPEQPGKIYVRVKDGDGKVIVEVADDGKGFEGKGSTASFGMKLIESLGQQLRTRAQWVPTKPGTLVRLSVPASQIS